MKVLVMGGTRFNGLALVRELARCGHEVWVVNRGVTQVELPSSVQRLVADRHDHAALRAALEGHAFDCVQDINAYTLDDVRSIVGILRGRMGHYVFASSTVIYAPSRTLPIHEGCPVDLSPRQRDYGRNKLLCEGWLLEEHRGNGLPATIVCFSMVFGPNNFIADREQRMFVRLLEGRPVLVPGDGTTLLQVGYVDDEARGLRMLMGNPATFGKRYNLTGAEYVSDEGYVDAFAAVVGRSAEKVFVPPAIMDTLPQREATMTQRLAAYIHRWNDSVIFSVDRLQQDTGWRPEYSFRGMVQATWEWYQAAGPAAQRSFDFSAEDALVERVRRHR
jgi:dTDP-glucose 4,6-dehydratase